MLDPIPCVQSARLPPSIRECALVDRTGDAKKSKYLKSRLPEITHILRFVIMGAFYNYWLGLLASYRLSRYCTKINDCFKNVLQGKIRLKNSKIF